VTKLASYQWHKCGKTRRRDRLFIHSRLSEAFGARERMRGLSGWHSCCPRCSSLRRRGAISGSDELMSLSFARTSHSITDIFVRFHYDNNHPLNTVFLYLAGVRQTLFIYPKLRGLVGIGSVFLVGYIAGKHWGAPEASCSIVLTGTSYPLLFTFPKRAVMRRRSFSRWPPMPFCSRTGGAFIRPRLVLFWAASILGVLSHSTFIMATIAFCIAGLAHEFRRPDPGGRNRFGSRLTMLPSGVLCLVVWIFF